MKVMIRIDYDTFLLLPDEMANIETLTALCNKGAIMKKGLSTERFEPKSTGQFGLELTIAPDDIVTVKRKREHGSLDLTTSDEFAKPGTMVQ